jgi:H+/Cl- antiporter ClcA
MKRLKHYDQIEVFSYVGTWLVTASLIALLAGTASAMFLLSLDNATTWRESHSWMIWLLPLAGLLVGLVYSWYGEPVNAGNNLIIDEIHDPKGGSDKNGTSGSGGNSHIASVRCVGRT